MIYFFYIKFLDGGNCKQHQRNIQKHTTCQIKYIYTLPLDGVPTLLWVECFVDNMFHLNVKKMDEAAIKKHLFFGMRRNNAKRMQRDVHLRSVNNQSFFNLLFSILNV